MSWAVGFDSDWRRWIGYGVPAHCDYPKCRRVINRGLAYVCGGQPYGGDDGCGLYFCEKHRSAWLCERCLQKKKPFRPKPEHRRWIHHLLTDESWAEWREENPDEVALLSKREEGKQR